MTELPECLQASLKMRCPRYDRTLTQRQRIEALEDYTLESAFVQGELTEERVEWLQKLRPVQKEWDAMTGWEKNQRTRTEVAVRHAKAALRPDLYDTLEGIEWMIKRLTEEIDRMEREAARCSRAYTMEVGS